MAVARNFDTEREKYSGREGHSFIINGKEWHTKSIAPPAAFIRKDRGFQAAIRFLLAVIVKDEREDFVTMVEDLDLDIDANIFDDIVVWLIEEYSNRPTELPVSSGSGDG